MELARCKACGKHPRIRVEWQPTAIYITLYCRKRTGKNKHNQGTWAGAASPAWCLQKVTKAWNFLNRKEDGDGEV